MFDSWASEFSGLVAGVLLVILAAVVFIGLIYVSSLLL